MITLVIPFFTDTDRLLSSLSRIPSCKILEYIHEILLCHNGNSRIPEINSIVPVDFPVSCRLLHTDLKGLGAGYKLGISHAKSDFVVLSASDLPFGTSDIENFHSHYKLNPSSQIIYIGSKAHPKSFLIGYPTVRKIFSFGFYLTRVIILNLKHPKDTQGTIIMPTSAARTLAAHTCSNDYFFSLELIAYGAKLGFKIIELPIHLIFYSAESSVHLFRDTVKMFIRLFRLRTHLKKVKEHILLSSI